MKDIRQPLSLTYLIGSNGVDPISEIGYKPVGEMLSVLQGQPLNTNLTNLSSLSSNGTLSLEGSVFSTYSVSSFSKSVLSLVNAEEWKTMLGLETISSDSVDITGGTITGVPINIQLAETFPVNPSPGNLFYNSSTGRLFVYYNDGTSAQWVDASPSSAGITDIKIIDDISSQFNNVTTAFNLTSTGEAIFPVSPQQITVVLNDILLKPGLDYIVVGSQIIFVSAPQTHYIFSGIIYGTSTTLSTVSDNSITESKIQNFSVTPSKLNINNHIIPASDNLYNLGSESLRFANIYTGDLHLRNERGDWTLIEEKDFLTIKNNKTGELFKLIMEEIK